MEEVKDEKLREELLGLVVEKNRKREDTKKEEEEPINYLARQAILGGATEEVAKLGWKIAFGFFSFFSIVFGSLALFSFLGFLFALFNKDENASAAFLGIAILSSIPALIATLGVYSLRSGKREYERLKRKSAN
jgi:hypothetical protein